MATAIEYEVQALRELARRARTLAEKMTVPFRKAQYLALAEEYEARADEIEKRGKDGR